MDHKTKPIYRETKIGILGIHEIENMIFDQLFLVRFFVTQNYESLDISLETISLLHDKLCHHIYDQAGHYRTHDVQIGTFVPVAHHQVLGYMYEFQKDIDIRGSDLVGYQDKIEFVSRIMRRFLWIHPFFDYNGRIARLLGELFCLKLGIPAPNFGGLPRQSFIDAMIYATDNYGDCSKIILLFADSGKVK